jgi:putative alpha-1,2-mannosidase
MWLPNPYYWPGNEHDLFSVWLFPSANRSDLTERYSRMIIDTWYGVGGNGLPGNDDYATMSAWLIFASLGFYPLPSTPSYILGSPYVHYARIDRKISENKTIALRIRANNNTK